MVLSAFGSAQADRYDGDGHRVVKNIGSTYYYLYDGDQVLATGQPTGALSGLNTWGADGLVSTRSSIYSVYSLSRAFLSVLHGKTTGFRARLDNPAFFW